MKISLRQSGLVNFFEIVIAGSELGANKPTHIRQVLRDWNFAPEEVAYIGDTAYDIEAVKEVGVLPIGALWAETVKVQKVKDAHPLASFENVATFIQWVQENL